MTKGLDFIFRPYHIRIFESFTEKKELCFMILINTWSLFLALSWVLFQSISSSGFTLGLDCMMIIPINIAVIGLATQLSLLSVLK